MESSLERQGDKHHTREFQKWRHSSWWRSMKDGSGNRTTFECAPARYAEAKCHTNKPAHLGVASKRVIGALMANMVSGPPPYVTAHRISVTDGELEFESAYLFTTLVMNEHGGPRPIKARDKKLYFDLTGKGWVRMEGESLFADDSVTKVVWNHIRDVFADPEEGYPVVVTTPPKTVGSKMDKWWALATKEGVDRVYKAWCDHQFSNQ